MSGSSGNSLMPGSLANMAALEPPGKLARIGRGMADLYEPIYSHLLANPDPEVVQAETDRRPYAVAQQAYDAQAKANEALYLRGLLGTAIPEQLRGAVPDIWRGVGQAAPFFAMGPLGGLRSLGLRDMTSAAANTLGWSAIGQPAMYAPEIWDWLNEQRKPNNR